MKNEKKKLYKMDKDCQAKYILNNEDFNLLYCSRGPRGPRGLPGREGGGMGTPGERGPTGATGTVSFPSAICFGDYLYFDPSVNTFVVGSSNITLGCQAGEIGQSSNSIAIGNRAGQTTQSSNSIAIGNRTGQTTQSSNSIAIGTQAGRFDQSSNSIAIGTQAALNMQGLGSIAIGTLSGNFNQQSNSIAVGNSAGQDNQSLNAVAIGLLAGNSTQGFSCIAIGNSAGQTSQGINSIAIGNSAGVNTQGINSIAIGNLAGANAQADNSIILNAQGSNLDSVVSDSTHIAPIRQLDSGNTLQILLYDDTTKEVIKSSVSTSGFDKTFVIEHPVDRDKYLVHACLEGPEAGVYYRGKAEIVDSFGGKLQNVDRTFSVTIELPYYVDKIATDLTVHLTPIFSKSFQDTRQMQLCAEEVIDNKFVVHGPPCKFNWIVYGKRKEIVVEPSKNEWCVSGDGPYRYIIPKK